MTWDDLKQHELVVYSTTWCPDCKRLKAHLDEREVAYEEIDIDADPNAAERLKKATGRTAIPYVQVDEGPMIRGWHDDKPGKWDENLFLAEVWDALDRDHE